MGQLQREQMIAGAALALVVGACVTLVTWSLQSRSGALQELADSQDALSRLESRARSPSAPGGQGMAAPMEAFLDAPTTGLAGADLQAYVERLANQHAALVSFAVQPASREDPPDTVRIEASLDISLIDLQVLLYQLESGTPYVFVESMTVRTAGAAVRSGAPDALRVTLALRALWRRRAA
jgi:general secretion pathway protein M